MDLTREQFVALLGPLSSNCPTVKHLSTWIYQTKYRGTTGFTGTDRVAQLQYIDGMVRNLRMKYSIVPWPHPFPIPQAFNLSVDQPCVVVSNNVDGQSKAKAAARKIRLTEVLSGALDYLITSEDVFIDWYSEVEAAASRVVKDIAHSRPLLITASELLNVSRQILSLGLCEQVATLEAFVQGMAQRFGGLNFNSFGVLEPLWANYLDLKAAKERLVETKTTFNATALGTAGAGRLLSSGIDRLGRRTRSEFDALTLHIEEPSKQQQLRYHLVRSFFVPNTTTFNTTTPPTTPPRHQRLAAVQAIELELTLNALNIGSDSDGDEDMTDVNVNNVNNVNSPGIFLLFGDLANDTNVESPAADTDFIRAMAQMLGVDQLAELLTTTGVGDKVVADAVVKPLLLKLCNELKYILLGVSGKLLLSQNAFNVYLLGPLNRAINALSLGTIAPRPIGSEKEFDIMHLPLIERILNATKENESDTVAAKAKEPNKGMVAAALDQHAVLKELSKLESTHTAFNERLEDKYDATHVGAMSLDFFFARFNDGTFLNNRTATSFVTHLTTVWLHPAMWVDSESRQEFIRVAMIGGNDDFDSLDYFFKAFGIFRYDFVADGLNVTVIWSCGIFKGREVVFKFRFLANVSDGKNIRYFLGQVDACMEHDLIAAGCINRASRRSIIMDTACLNHGVPTFYCPITLTNEFLKIVHTMNKEQLYLHGMRPGMLERNEPLYAVKSGHDSTTCCNDTWHSIFRTASNFVRDIAILLCQIRTMSFAIRWLKYCAQYGCPISLGDHQGRLKCGAKKIAYYAALIIDCKDLMFSFGDTIVMGSADIGKDCTTSVGKMFGDDILGKIIVGMVDVFALIARTVLGTRKETEVLLPYLTRNVWCLVSARSLVFGTRQIMPTETDLMYRVPFWIKKMYSMGLTGKKLSMGGAEEDNFYLKKFWANMSNGGGGIGAGQIDPHTNENAATWTAGNELMYKSLLRMMVSQVSIRMCVDEREQFKKTTVDREMRRIKAVKRWARNCTKKYPITEQARSALHRLFPRETIGTNEADIADDDVFDAIPVVDLEEVLTNGDGDGEQQQPQNDDGEEDAVQFFMADDEENNLDDADVEPEEEEEEEIFITLEEWHSLGTPKCHGNSIDSVIGGQAWNSLSYVQIQQLARGFSQSSSDQNEAWVRKAKAHVSEVVAAAAAAVIVVQQEETNYTEEQVIQSQTIENYIAARQTSDKQKENKMSITSMVFGQWTAIEKSSLGFNWCNKLISFKKNSAEAAQKCPDVKISLSFNWFKRTMAIDVQSLALKRLHVEVGAHLNATIRFHRIKRIVVVPMPTPPPPPPQQPPPPPTTTTTTTTTTTPTTTPPTVAPAVPIAPGATQNNPTPPIPPILPHHVLDGSTCIFKIVLDAPPGKFKKKSWKETSATNGKFEPVDGGINPCAPIVGGPSNVVNVVNSEQVVQLVVVKDQHYKNVLDGFRNFWLIPIVYVTPGTPEPLVPSTWNLEAACTRLSKTIDQFPGATTDIQARNIILDRCSTLLSLSSIGTQKEEDVGEILCNTCFQCDATVFVPNRSDLNPFPMASTRSSDGVEHEHFVCKMHTLSDQDTPGVKARAQHGFSKKWPNVTGERKTQQEDP